jgi:hypothetical protein
MARTSTFDAHDQHMGGQLTVLLTTWRAEERSYEEIAVLLLPPYGIHVVASTVYRWCRRLPVALEEAS